MRLRRRFLKDQTGVSDFFAKKEIKRKRAREVSAINVLPSG